MSKELELYKAFIDGLVERNCLLYTSRKML